MVLFAGWEVPNCNSTTVQIISNQHSWYKKKTYCGGILYLHCRRFCKSVFLNKAKSYTTNHPIQINKSCQGIIWAFCSFEQYIKTNKNVIELFVHPIVVPYCRIINLDHHRDHHNQDEFNWPKIILFEFIYYSCGLSESIDRSMVRAIEFQYDLFRKNKLTGVQKSAFALNPLTSQLQKKRD